MLLSPVGEELEALPLPPEEVVNTAADVLGAVLELLVPHRSIYSLSWYGGKIAVA